MKMTSADYAALKELVRLHRLPMSRATYEVEGLTERRWVFDHLWNIPAPARQDWFDGQPNGAPIYSYLDDDHIYTALRRAIRELDEAYRLELAEDRGDSDAYYGRPAEPHIWLARDPRLRLEAADMSEAEIAAYRRGYAENLSGRKEWN